MTSSSVYSFSSEFYKKATQFYNDYISNDKVQREKLVKDRLQEINNGEIIFSKNNVCIHLNEPLKDSRINSKGGCNKNCIPGYLSVKLIKNESNGSNFNDDNQKLNQNKDKNVKETSFIVVKDEFNLDQELNKLSKDNENSDNNLIDDENNELNNFKNNSIKKNSIYLKQNTTIENNSRKNSSTDTNQKSSIHSYSMIINWLPNFIFKEPNKLTRNLSFKQSNSLNHLRKKFKSLNNLTIVKNLPKLNKQNSTNQIQLRSYSSDTHLNLNSLTKSSDNLLNEDSLIFTIDIKKIKSLKLFFGSQINRDDDEMEQSENSRDGQLVIGNYDLMYKIFHFHNGGLQKFEQFLNDFDFIFLLKQKNSTDKFLNFFENLYDGDFNGDVYDFYMNKFVQFKNEYNNNDCQSFIKFYTIDLPALNYIDLQNEFNYKPLSINSIDEYNQYFSSDGQLIYDFEKLKTRVFFGSGCESSCRKFFWPYLLNRFSLNLSNKEKNEIKKHGEFLYQQINQKRLNIKKEDKFYKKFIQFKSTIFEDVPRTDRLNPKLKDKVKIMQRILLNYTIYSPRIGYTQGFSDLLAPLVIVLNEEPESEIFFNFVYLLEKKQFFCLPNDISIDTTIAKIRELLRILDIKIYNYFKELGEQSFQLLWTHRWMLLCFRREFEENSALKIWEICWSDFQIHFQLFICVAIIQIYSIDIIDKKMNSDDILFYFSNLSHKMPFELVIKKARSNLFQFKSFNKLPCTLKSLHTNKSNSLSWTTQIKPYFECIGSTNIFDAKLLCKCDKQI